MTTLQFPLLLAQDGGAIVPGNPAPASQPATESSPGTSPPLTTPGAQRPAGGGASGFNMLLPLIVVMVVLVLMTSLGGRKEKKKRAELLASVSRNDRVQTVGGIIGTVVELTDTEMVLRVDEAANTRIRFARSAIQQVLRSSRDKGNGTDVEVKPAVPSRV